MAGKTSGAGLIDSLEGSEHALSWGRAIVEVFTGTTTVVAASESLGCNEAYFYRRREEALQAMVTSLEPKRPGRKPAQVDPEAQRVKHLEEELLRAKAFLEAASARVTLALGVPETRRRPKGRRRAPPPTS